MARSRRDRKAGESQALSLFALRHQGAGPDAASVPESHQLSRARILAEDRKPPAAIALDGGFSDSPNSVRSSVRPMLCRSSMWLIVSCVARRPWRFAFRRAT